MNKCKCGKKPIIERHRITRQYRIACRTQKCIEFPYNETGWSDDIESAEEQWNRTTATPDHSLIERNKQ